MAIPNYTDILVHTDYLVDAPEKHLQSLTVRFPAKSLTISQIIKIKISQEIHAFNERSLISYGADYLSIEEYQDVLSEGTQHQQSTVVKGKGNPDRESKAALRAFFDKRFHVEINGQVYSEEGTAVINDRTTIRFVRLFPYNY